MEDISYLWLHLNRSYERMIKVIPKYIADKVIQYDKAQQKADKLYHEIESYLDNKHLGVEGVYSFSIVDAPTGIEQSNGGFCDQVQYYEDCYRGTYYWPLKDGRYLAGKFEC